MKEKEIGYPRKFAMFILPPIHQQMPPIHQQMPPINQQMPGPLPIHSVRQMQALELIIIPHELHNDQPLAAGLHHNPTDDTQMQAHSIPSTAAAWTTGICSCYQDYFSSCLTAFLPCVTFGLIALQVDNDCFSGILNGVVYLMAWSVGVHPCYSCIYRKKLRSKYNLPEKPCNDCCTHWCCEACALCQEYRELRNRS